MTEQRGWAGLQNPSPEDIEERKAVAFRCELRKPAWTPPSNLGDRNVWRWVGDDPWTAQLVNRDGYTPDGICLFPKEGKA